MQTTFQFNEIEYSADLQSGVSIARSPKIEDGDFEIKNVNVQRRPFVHGDFTGDVSQGGSCNVDVLKINPHCGMTHTETILHILDRTILDRSKCTLKEVSLAAMPTPIFVPCVLVTVTPVAAKQIKQSDESYQPKIGNTDLVITADDLESAISGLNLQTLEIETPFAIVVRSSNDETWSFDSADPVPYFTNEAMEYISQSACQHLLVDLPSVDRRDDDGVLSNHRLFWNVGTKNVGTKSVGTKQSELSKDLRDSRVGRTITEMVSVPSTLTDGIYLLDLQFIPLNTDASPSRPVLFRAIA